MRLRKRGRNIISFLSRTNFFNRHDSCQAPDGFRTNENTVKKNLPFQSKPTKKRKNRLWMGESVWLCIDF